MWCLSIQVVLHFYATWSEPCKHMDVVFKELATECKGTVFKRVTTGSGHAQCRMQELEYRFFFPTQVDAEEVDDVTTHFGVSSVPTFVFLQVHRTACGPLCRTSLINCQSAVQY